MSGKKQQAYRHHHHASDKAKYCHMMFTIGFGGWKKLVQGYIYHYPGNSGKDQSEHGIIEYMHEQKITEKCTDWFGKTRKKRIKECLFSLPRSKVDRG